MDEEMLPKFNYYIDESDPDIVVLRRQDGSFAAAFSARGATTEGIVEATKEDYRKLIEAHAGSMDLREALRAARSEFCRAKGEPKGVNNIDKNLPRYDTRHDRHKFPQGG